MFSFYKMCTRKKKTMKERMTLARRLKKEEEKWLPLPLTDIFSFLKCVGNLNERFSQSPNISLRFVASPMAETNVSSGEISPLGVSQVEKGINFALFSHNATSVTLCLSLPQRYSYLLFLADVTASWFLNFLCILCQW